MTFDSQMPRDPFADDPNDPASFLTEEEPVLPLTEEERRTVEEELEMVRDFHRYLLPRGMLGILSYCEDCGETHYFDWEILAANLQATLADQPSPVHEPGARPDPEAYVQWDYAAGYLDGLFRR